MGQFHEKPFAQRFTALGDQAEAVFEAVYPEGFAVFGLRRPPINLRNVPAKIRHAPDYLTGKGFVEVGGFGRDGIFKLKHAKYEALEEWHTDFRCDIFVYDSKQQRYGFVRVPELREVLPHMDEREFHDGNRYYAIPAQEIPVVEWLDYTTET